MDWVGHEEQCFFWCCQNIFWGNDGSAPPRKIAHIHVYIKTNTVCFDLVFVLIAFQSQLQCWMDWHQSGHISRDALMMTAWLLNAFNDCFDVMSSGWYGRTSLYKGYIPKLQKLELQLHLPPRLMLTSSCFCGTFLSLWLLHVLVSFVLQSTLFLIIVCILIM